MRAASGRALEAWLAPSLAALLLALTLLSGGTNESRLSWIGVVALFGASLAAAAALAGHLPVPVFTRASTLFLFGLAAFCAWNGLSIVWSVEPDRSWDYFNRSLVYFALASVGVLAGAAGRHAARVVAAAFAAVLAAALLWALACDVLPALDPRGDVIGRLRGTLDYWNAFALVTAWALPVAVWIGSARHVHARLAGGLLAYAATVALLLTFSRGGLLVACGALALWFWLAPDRHASAATLLAGALPGIAVALVGFALPGVSSDAQPRDVRWEHGLVFGVALGVGAALVVLLARRDLAALSARLPRRALAAVIAALLLAAAGALGTAALLDSGPLTIHAGPGRFLKLGSSDRLEWWSESVDIFRERPLAGSGAGTFDVARRPFREDESVAVEPHNMPLQVLAELGLVGFLLFALVVAGGIAGAMRQRDPAARVLAVVCAAYLVHSLLELDWDYLALTGPAVLLSGVLVAAGQPARRLRPGLLLSAAAVVLGVAGALSLITPRVAESRLDDARALISSSPAEAAEAAQDAHELNPFSEDALREWALAEELAGNTERARGLYVDATELQPENPDTWRALGTFELDTLEDPAAARRSLTRARELDPQNPDIVALLQRAGAG